MVGRRIEARVVIVIVSWNTRAMTAQCLQSIEREIGDATAGAFEVVVVDNGSSDDSVPMLERQFPWAHLIRNQENVGFAKANNQGIGASQTEFVLLLNSDTELEPRALEELVSFMYEHPKAGAAAAMLLNKDGSLQESCRPMLTPGREFWRLSYLDRIWPRASYRMVSWDAKKARQIEVMMGACMMLRRQALDDVGILDERYFMYTEEVDLCYRLLAKNWELWFVPTAKVTHFGQASSRQVADEMFVQLYRSKIQFYRKIGGDQLAGRFKLLLRLAYLPRLALAKVLSPLKNTASGQAARYSRLLDELASM